MSTTVAIRALTPDDAALADPVAALVNRVYAVAERGIWRDGTTRTTAAEMAELIAAREMAVAELDGAVVGAVQLHDVADDVSEFGMLASAPEQRGVGIGVALLDFAEGRSRERGLRAMQLELLVPRGWSHPSKEFLTGWYGRRGYRLVRTTTIEASHPQLGPLLATDCDLQILQKPL